MNLCPSCNHPAKLHINSMCSNAKCYCTEAVPIEVAQQAHWYDVVNVNGDQLTLDDPERPFRGEHWERGSGSVIIEIPEHNLEAGDKVLLAIIGTKRGT